MSRSQVCADASFLAKLVLPEIGSDTAKNLWDQWEDSDISVLAPSLILYEFTSAINKYVQRKWLPPARGREALDFLLRLPLDLVAGAALHRAALALAADLSLPSAYDAHYLAVARDLDCPLWTGDRRMRDSAAQAGVSAHYVGAEGDA